MALQDKVQEQTNEAKNALEAYVYGLRSKLYDQLSEYVTDDFKESTSKRLEQMEVHTTLCDLDRVVTSIASALLACMSAICHFLYMLSVGFRTTLDLAMTTDTGLKHLCKCSAT